MSIVIESEKRDVLSHITQILKLLCTEEMNEEEFLNIKRRWFTERFMFGGFQHAIYELHEFWRKNGKGLKAYRLFTYKGIDLILNKLEDNMRSFFYKGGDVEISFTEKELESIRSVKRKPHE